VERFTVEAYVDGAWSTVAEGTTIGYKRMLKFEECAAERIRVTINECRATANISNIALFSAAEIEE
jgi:alpha-L-fucosidase